MSAQSLPGFQRAQCGAQSEHDLPEKRGEHISPAPLLSAKGKEQCPPVVFQIILKAWRPKALPSCGFMNHFETPVPVGFAEKVASKCKMTI